MGQLKARPRARRPGSAIPAGAAGTKVSGRCRGRPSGRPRRGRGRSVDPARASIRVQAWNSIWAEDHKIFLPAALLHPWSSLFQAYDGYLELLPRLIAEGVARLPFSDAAVAFALAGATIASCCAVFVFHACSGHVRTPALRVLLAVSVLLLPTAIVEIANSGVNSPWYLLFAVFWALLWRPPSRIGMAAAALVCFAAASSNALAALYLPLVAARVIALPRLREQAATIGWLAGGALQVPVVFTLTRNHQPASLVGALGFYGRIVILPAVAGHHLALQLWAGVGLTGAMMLAGFIVAVAVAWGCLLCGAQARALVIAAVVLGILLAFVPLLVHGNVTTRGFSRTGIYVRGSRYGQAPILLIDSAVIVAVDAYLRRGGVRFVRVAHVVAAVLLVAVLGTSWVSDYRYVNKRSTLTPWSQTVARVEHRCRQFAASGSRAADIPALLEGPWVTVLVGQPYFVTWRSGGCPAGSGRWGLPRQPPRDH